MTRQPTTSSPWPLFVALGIAGAEVGVVFGLIPVAIGGILLFGGSTAGVIREAGYADTIWEPLQFVGVVIGVLAGVGLALRASALTPSALRVAAVSDPLAIRAVVVLTAAAVLVALGTVAPVVSKIR